MPQLVIPDFVPQLIWLAITFVTLYLVMARIALPGIGGIIEQRRDRIASDLDEAERLKKESEQAIAAYEAALAEARAQAHATTQKMREQLRQQTESRRAELDAELAEKIAAAEDRIAAARKQAEARIQEVAAEVAGDIVKQLIGTAPAKRAVQAAAKRAAG